MLAPFAAYVPVCTSCFTAKGMWHGSSTPRPQPTQQDVAAAGIIAVICLAGFAWLLITDLLASRR